ncbi:MAG: hypothetical protein ACTSWY_01760 [Promethearchaeota archaeon]
MIDTSVYKETVDIGIKNNYPDAISTKKWLQTYKIPIIPIDIAEELSIYRDPGETSCAILVAEDKQESVCITSDKKTIKKFEITNIPHTQLDTFYYKLFLDSKITDKAFIDILYKLEAVYATSPERILYFYELIQQNPKIKRE